MTATALSRTPFRGKIICCAAALIASIIILCEYYTVFFNLSTTSVLLGEWSSVEHTTPNSTALRLELVANFGNKTKTLFLLGRQLQPSTKNVLFVETSCAIERKPPGNVDKSEIASLQKELGVLGGLKLTPKQACSIYSVAHLNPTRKVVLLYTCPLSSIFYKESSDSVKTLFDLPNFSLAEVNLTDLYAETPLEQFLDVPLQKSSFKVEHASDALRYFVVYLYGGTYMDLDIVSMKPLDDLGTNFIVAQEIAPTKPPILASGVFNFEPRHGFMKECVLKVYEDYDPLKWSTIGPDLVTKTLRDYCNLTLDMRLDTVGTISGCNITVWKSQAYYAIKYWNWKEYYKEGAWPAVKRQLSGAFGAHVWNHMGSLSVIIGSSQPYGMLAEKHCNPVYVRAGAHFKR